MDKNLLKRALEDTEDPTPGYMFRDIANWTFIDHNTQTKLIAYLMERLKPNVSVHVLAKTLKVIKVLCETGHSDFQKEIQRISDDLKQFAAYRGKPDAKYGDKLNEKVRTSAREAIDAAFTHRKESVKVQVMSGHGSDTTFDEKKSTFSTGMVVSGGDSSGASANAHMAAMPTTNKWAEHMAAVAQGKEGGPGAQPGVVASFVESAKTGFGFWQENVKSTEQRVMESMNAGTEFRPVELGFSGGTFGANAGGSTASSGGTWKFTEEATTTGGGGAGASLLPKEEPKILTPFQLEVEKLCAFKNTPQRVDLTQFVAAIEGVAAARDDDLEELAEVLDERLQQKYNWQQRLNAMAGIEAVLRSTLAGRASFETYFKENPEDLQRNVHVVQGSLKEKAQKVLKILGIPERTSATVESSAAQQITVATGGGGISWASAVPVSAAVATQPTTSSGSVEPGADSGADLLGGMTVKSRGKAVASAEEKTKLRKRAAMQVQEEPEPASEPVAQTSRTNLSRPAQQQPSVASASSDAGAWGSWGDAPPASTSSGGWGFDALTTGATPPATTATSTSAPTKRSDALDDFFVSSSSGLAPSLVPPIPAAPLNTVGTPPAPTPAPLPAAPPSVTTQMILQMQQQMQLLMSQINMSDPNALAQVQALMQQQQQLMALVAAQSQAHSSPLANNAQLASSASSTGFLSSSSATVVPHGQFQVSVPPRTTSVPQNDSFAAVQREMMSKMLQKQ